MMARPYYMVVALLLLAEFTRFEEGTPNPGFVARITGKGLEYARQYGEATLKNELSTTKMHDLSGSYGIDWLGSVNYVFSGMRIHRFLLQDSQLSLHPGQGIKASLSDNYVSVGGNWKVEKSFITLHGTFDLSVDGISILVSLNLGKDQSGRPTVSVIHCHNSISQVSVEISGHISWILNLFHERIENNVKPILEQKEKPGQAHPTQADLEFASNSGSQDLRNGQEVSNLPLGALSPHPARFGALLSPLGAVRCRSTQCPWNHHHHLPRTLGELSPSSISPSYMWTSEGLLSGDRGIVTLMIDQIAGIDYSLVGAPQVTSQGLDTPFKGEFFGRNWNTSVPFDAPPITLPQKHDHMIYFAVSEYAFNTASRVYYQAGQMKFTIQNKHIPLDFPIQLHTSSFWAIIPQLAMLYPNMDLELETSPESAPFLTFTPGNVTFMPVMDIQAFVLLPNSAGRKSLFQIRASTNIFITINVNSTRITGSLTTGSELKLELKHSNIGFFNVNLMESIFNYYALHTVYPSLNAKLEEGIPLPLPRDTYLNSLEFQIHENFLFLGANVD
ncbi:hypothetical protein R6Z07M_012522 [Ovis aries]